MPDSVEALIKDLASRLSSIAQELGERAERIGGQVRGETGDPWHKRVAAAERLLAERRRRTRFLPTDLFHEPAWDMLLTLFLARRRNLVLNVKALVASAEAPATTSQRWIEHMAQLRLVDRITDPADRRRIEVVLSDAGEDAIARYLDALG